MRSDFFFNYYFSLAFECKQFFFNEFKVKMSLCFDLLAKKNQIDISK